MSPPHATLILILALSSSISHISSHTSSCTHDFSQMGTKRNITHCVKLSTLGAQFAWNNIILNNNSNSKIDIIFSAKMENDKGWVAWGVNPGETAQMVGTRALIGIKNPDGSMKINTYNVTSLTRIGFPFLPSKIELVVEKRDLVFQETIKHLVIYATIVLPTEYNISRLNIVWQVGHEVDELEPKIHSATLENMDSIDTIDLESGVVEVVGVNRQHLRMVHGILNIVGWGTILPIGVILSRYLKRFPCKYKYWFRLHASTQCVGYVLGVSGWIIGLVLGHASSQHTFRTHRILGICIFTFTTLQMFALRLKPNMRDEFREYWNMYHHFLGYSLLAIIATNIFQGFAILRPRSHKWEQSYIGILGALGLITLGFELVTWIKFIRLNKNRQKTSSSTQDADQAGGTTPPEGS
ncbi:hypothetical protein LguiA_023325 [Lonicera macranthoides]